MTSAWRVDIQKFLATRHPDAVKRRTKLQYVALDPDLHCVLAHRYGRWADAQRESHPITGMVPVVVHRVWNRWVTGHHNTDISRFAQVGPGFLLMHRHGVFIGPVRIGGNCVVHQNVTIGEQIAGGSHDCPAIGDGVWIGPGAILSGRIEIGDGVTISSGSVLSKSVPERCLVAGNPARVIQREYDNSALINFFMVSERPRSEP